MPPSLSEWLPEVHLAWLVLDVVAELDLSELYRSLRQDRRGGASQANPLGGELRH
jgi:hypothetical protein